MYRHLAESIKENEAKQFMTQKEVDTLNMYENTLRKKEDTYNKQELEDFIKEFDTVVETVQGSHITIDESRNAMIDNIEIYGKTVQNSIDLTDIKSVGNKLSDGRYEIPIVCTGKNMFNGKYQQGYYPGGSETGEFRPVTDPSRSTYPIKVKPNTKYTKTKTNRSVWHFYRADGSYIGNIYDNNPTTITTPDETEYMTVYYHNGDPSSNLPVIGNLEELMIVEGDSLPTTYEPYVEYRSKIILPCKLEKIGNIPDRLFVNNKGNWCIEKNIKTVTIDESFIIKRREDLDSENTERYSIILPDQDIMHFNDLPYPVFSSKIKCVVENDSWVVTELSTNIFGHNSVKEVHIKRLKTDNTIFTDLTSLKTLLNGSILKYVTENPSIIPLPDNQQVKLKSFKGVTHIYFDCEISGEINCDVNKTKKSIVNSITKEFKNISNELEDIEKMEKGLLTTVKSENYLVDIEKTNNGYISDICIEGKTLVNLSTLSETGAGLTSTPNLWEASYDGLGYFKIGFTHSDNLLNGRSIDQSNTPILKGKIYTIIFNVKNNTRTVNTEILPMTWDYATEVIGSPFVKSKHTGIHVYKFKAIKDYNFKIGYKSANPVIDGGYIEFGDILLLEGDHTDKPLSYFEGLKSVGDGVDSISLTSNNANLLDINKLFNNTGPHCNCTSSVNGNVVTITNTVSIDDSYTNTGITTKDSVPAGERQFAIPVEEGKTYKYSRYVQIMELFEAGNNRSSEYISFVDKNYRVLSLVGIEYKVTIDKTYNEFEVKAPKGAKYMTFRVGIRAKAVCEYSDMEIKEVSSLGDKYLPHKSDTKQLFIKNSSNEWVKPVLRSLPNGTKDTIEKHSNGKYYYHKRCEEMYIDGSREWKYSGPEYGNDRYSLYVLYSSNFNGLGEFKKSGSCICDKLKAGGPISRPSYIGEGIATGGNLDIKLRNDRFTTISTENFKQWLADNPMTLVYELLHEEVYECSPIDLQTFDGTTTLLIESGHICPKTSVSVVSDIGATLHVLKEKISNLETQIADNNTFGSVVLLQSSYSADVASLQFNISVCGESRISNDFIIYDNDIYVLIKDVILNGKDLINLEYLETIIDFYIMVNKISFEMADELFDLLYADESYIEE